MNKNLILDINTLKGFIKEFETMQENKNHKDNKLIIGFENINLIIIE